MLSRLAFLNLFLHHSSNNSVKKVDQRSWKIVGSSPDQYVIDAVIDANYCDLYDVLNIRHLYL